MSLSVCVCESVLVCLFTVLNETALLRHTYTYAPFLVFRHAQWDNLDSHSKHKSPLGPLPCFLFGPWTVDPIGCWTFSTAEEPLSKHSDMLWSFSRAQCKENHTPATIDSSQPTGSHLGS